MQTGLAGPVWSRVRDQAEESAERLESAINLASSLSFVKETTPRRWSRCGARRTRCGCVRLDRSIPKRCIWRTMQLSSSHTKASTLRDAEQTQREVHGLQKRAPGAENPSTLTTAQNLAASLFGQGKHEEAAELFQAVFAARQCVFGAAHPHTLATAHDLKTVRAHMRTSKPNAKA